MTSPTTHQPAATDTSSSSVAANPPTADLPKPFSKGEVDYTNMTPHQRKNWEESLKKKPGKSFKIAGARLFLHRASGLERVTDPACSISLSRSLSLSLCPPLVEMFGNSGSHQIFTSR